MKTDTSFLEKVKVKGHLDTIQSATQVTEVVFRTMRDLMTTEASDRIGAELQRKAAPEKAVPTAPEVPRRNIADLWQDTNPVVGFLSRIEPPQHLEAETFLYMIRQEANLPEGITTEEVVKAVFSATKQELSAERIDEVATFLPDKIQEIWQQA
ncbi:MAG TPA: DUF2267 domain-containing protein [Cyanophyceae cyanobacterium]